MVDKTIYTPFYQANIKLIDNGDGTHTPSVYSVSSPVDLVLGNVPGTSLRDKFGYIRNQGMAITIANPATWVDLWAFGGQRTAPTGTFTPFMASDDPLDTGIEITWPYLDANGLENEVSVILNGTTPVPLGVTASDITRGFNDGATDLVGNVYCTTANNFTGGVPDNQNEVLAFIPINDGQTQQALFRVPSDKTAIITRIYASMSRTSGAAGSGILSFDIRETGKTWRSLRPPTISTSNGFERLPEIVLPPSTDVRIRVRDISDNGTDLEAEINYILVGV